MAEYTWVNFYYRKMPATSKMEYPVGLVTLPLLGEDRAFHHRRLLEGSARLLKHEEVDLEVLQCSDKRER